MPVRRKSSMKKSSRKRVSIRSSVSGRGDYTIPAKYKRRALRSGGALLGSVVGHSLGYTNEGRKIGRMAGAKLSKVMGYGDYYMNSLFSGADPVRIQNSTSKSHIIRHREYIGQVQATNAFTQNQYSINPGLENVFPWLSTIAQSYEEYKIHGMYFEFKSTSANALNSTNTALGTIVMAVQYNPANAPFINKQAMENYEGCVSGAPSDSLICGVECARNKIQTEQLSIRTGAVPSGQDARLYDLGVLSVASVGSQATSDAGELWCCYEIEFVYPKLFGGQLGSNINSCHMILQASSVSNTQYMGAAGTAIIAQGSSFACYQSATNLNVIYFPTNIAVGAYRIQWRYTGASTPSVATGSLVTSSNVTGLTTWNNRTASYSSQVSDNNTMAYYTLDVTINNPSFALAWAGMTSGTGTIPGTLTYAEIYVTQLNYSQL